MNEARQKKKERRKARYIRNVEKEKTYKEQAWNDGKLLEPNHNNGPYPPEYCIELGKRLVGIIKTYKSQTLNNEMFLQFFRLYKNKIRDFILHYSPEIEKSEEYNYLKNLLEIYWDEPDKLYEKTIIK